MGATTVEQTYSAVCGTVDAGASSIFDHRGQLNRALTQSEEWRSTSETRIERSGGSCL